MDLLEKVGSNVNFDHDTRKLSPIHPDTLESHVRMNHFESSWMIVPWKTHPNRRSS